MRGSLVAALAVTAAALAGVVVLEFQRDPGGQTLPAGPTLPASTQAASPEHTNDPAPAKIATLLARPLFAPNRRPAATPATTTTNAAGLPRLTGVMITPAGRSVMFANEAGGKSVVAVEGTRIGAYVVQSIDAGTVTILGPDGIRTLRPSFDPNRPPPPAAPIPARPARTPS